MKKNDIYPLTADALGADMEGVCRHEGMAVFVPGMLPGEECDVRIVKVQPRFAFGRMESEIRQISPERRENDCPVYPRCGGCSCRHMSYQTTLEQKRQQVVDCFKRIGHIDAQVLPVIGMEDPSHYRNKTALPIGGTAENPQAGFFAPRSHSLIPIDSCLNAMEPANTLTRVFLGWMKDFRVAPYREEEHRGLVRHLVIRVNRKGQAMVTVAVNGTKLPHEDELARRLLQHGAVSVIFNENRDRTNVILGRKFRTIAGPDMLEDVLCGLRFELSPAAFFQVNPRQTEKLYSTALEFAQLKEDDALCDVYCGAGTITLMMAQHCRRALGIEIVPQAIDNARKNVERNGVGNADFRVGAAEDVLPRLVDEGLRPDVIVVDPPRKGLESAVIDAMAKAGPRRIVYVSCNVATQARDAALLEQAGYHLERVQPVDMFCWTSGVESVASFVKA
ncbi:MAG: 23S rRNA (uracil(1939)-C(5))-methyltransferase RlmD [Clostridia bacterium]|nr:23S rRNA (uracil(1939)-C(5))-methyltransferase RlmD [Clostridia bacterium]